MFWLMLGGVLFFLLLRLLLRPPTKQRSVDGAEHKGNYWGHRFR